MADAASDYIPERMRIAVRNRARELCEYCRLPQWFQDAAFHIDHILPQSRNGPTEPGNLALACVGCSLRKGSIVVGHDPLDGLVVPLFNPRRDRWEDHFAFTKKWLIEGCTPCGRATIEVLRLNRPSLVRLRKYLARRKQFPPAIDDA